MEVRKPLPGVGDVGWCFNVLDFKDRTFYGIHLFARAVLTINIDASHIGPIMVPLSLIVSKNFHSDWSVGGCRSHEQNAGCSRSI